VNIRAAQASDIPAIADLYEKVMRSGSGTAPPGLKRALSRLFLDGPAYDAEIPPLVMEQDGDIVGFQGIQVRPLQFEGQSLRLAALGPVFVAPEVRSRAAGAVLIKAAMSGAQDLSIADGALEEIRQMWERLGGLLAVPQTIEWNIPLRPAALGIRWLARRYKTAGKLTAWATTPLAILGDALVDSRWNSAVNDPPAPLPTASPLDASRMAELSSDLEISYRLQATYPPAIARWVFEQLEAYGWRGELVARELRKSGKPIGWFFAHASRDRIFRVMEIHADPRNLPSAVAGVINEATRRKMLAVCGRIDGGLAGALTPYRVRFSYGMRVLVHARDRAVLDAFLALDSSISRIDGESLAGILQQPYGD
jgi:hypothetical protein